MLDATVDTLAEVAVSADWLATHDVNFTFVPVFVVLSTVKFGRLTQWA
jgi:hypothetical protein